MSGIILTLDLTGASRYSKIHYSCRDWWRLQFLGDMYPIEPGLHYSLDLNEDLLARGVFQFNIGFVYIF
jgi:hypothetical protein